MRPRVFPAEDLIISEPTGAGKTASMRPRVFPAEDDADSEYSACASVCFNEAAGIPRGRHVPPRQVQAAMLRASMRPRVFPAEDARIQATVRGRGQASMRPRVFPAEDAASSVCSPTGSSGFNEAAGIPRGRRKGLDVIFRGLHGPASMRPRVFPAEDAPAERCGPAPSGRFNEAAGIPRGRHEGRHRT